ncbi:MAG: NUDIX domain-containing protein [Chloroflexota bacterium]|nr:NUDIX domain-containing protein [Chloroflexota bacterium]
MTDLVPIRKVTAFITRDRNAGRELLVFFRPDDGMTQLPAGTIEEGEAPEAAVLREAAEETGLTALRIVRELSAGWQMPFGRGTRLLTAAHPLCVERGRITASLPRLMRGLTVHVIGEPIDGWTRVSYRDYGFDHTSGAVITRWEKRGWLPLSHLTDRVWRHFYHLLPIAPVGTKWTHHDPADDGRALDLHWLPMALLASQASPLHPMQRRWVHDHAAALGTPGA